MISIILVCIFVIISIILGYFFSDKVIKVHVFNHKEVLQTAYDRDEFDVKLFDNLITQEIIIPSTYGYDLAGKRIRSEKNSGDKVMVFSHGVGTNSMSSIKYAMLFIDMGWDAIIYDHRRHGESKGRFSSYGLYEKDDLSSVVSYTKNIYGTDVKIGIHGESMGSAIAIQYAGVYGNVDFFIFDCPYSDLKKQLTYRLQQEFKLKGFYIMPLVDLFIKLRIGFSFKDVAPINFVDKIKKPTLFIHSKGDKYILPYMCEELYQKKNGIKALYMAVNGDHAESYTFNRDEYKKQIEDFLTNNNI